MIVTLLGFDKASGMDKKTLLPDEVQLSVHSSFPGLAKETDGEKGGDQFQLLVEYNLTERFGLKVGLSQMREIEYFGSRIPENSKADKFSLTYISMPLTLIAKNVIDEKGYPFLGVGIEPRSLSNYSINGQAYNPPLGAHRDYDVGYLFLAGYKIQTNPSVELSFNLQSIFKEYENSPFELYWFLGLSFGWQLSTQQWLRADTHAMEYKPKMMWMDTVIEQSDAISGSSSSAVR